MMRELLSPKVLQAVRGWVRERLWRDRLVRGRLVEKSGDRVISTSISALEKNTGCMGEVEHRRVRGKANGEKRGFWDSEGPLAETARRNQVKKQAWEDGGRTGQMIAGLYGSQEPWVKTECVLWKSVEWEPKEENKGKGTCRGKG